MKGIHLGEFEELVLLAVATLEDNAYAVSIQSELHERVDRKANISAIHTALYRMEDKGFLESTRGGAEAKRGGKNKRLFRVTTYGYNMLKESKATRESFWNVLPQISTN
ncbi:helix-turn-helix transcriptional regulator [Roseivirga misakiensis]|uniref:PadR family transcriptional regulator n=1 Tax=Roseivirga misakiensis TaxID=1563681 RepID=A0A1E5T018_9BACT|nr:helix-turn-helix transcriptional regulator [Roseivirga misakiensis]OEK04728.1 PadR family transcriptional regulator [Roseivirga misakiensis]